MKKDSTVRTRLAPMGLALLLFPYSGCKKDEPPPPLQAEPSANKPSAPLVLRVEEASARRVVAPSSVQMCCDALGQNAAAAECNAAVAQGKDKASIARIVSKALRGARAPAACKAITPKPPPHRSGGSSV